MGKGTDLKKGMIDDVGFIDYSGFPKPKPKIRKIRGVRYRKLSEEVKAKKKSIRDPKFVFRHKKDRGDLNRIRFYKKTHAKPRKII